MAKIKHQGMGNATVVLLSQEDRADLHSALIAYASEQGLSMSALAKEIGVNRTYLYSLMDANQIELSRLVHIQKITDFNLISDADAHLYLQNLMHSITQRSNENDWIELCECVELHAFYVKRFLLPALIDEMGALNQIFSASEALQPESILPTFSHESYFASLIESFTGNAITALGGEHGDIDERFYCDEEVALKLEFPVLLTSSAWLDVFELAREHTHEYFRPSEDIESFTVDSYRGYRASLPGYIAGKEEEEEYSNNLNYLRVTEAGKEAERLVMRCAKRIDEWVGWIADYCRNEKRMLRRRLYFPLELEQICADPERHSIPIILADKKES